MNWKNFIGGVLVGITLAAGTLAWAHAERSGSQEHGMGMMGMMSQMQDMMVQCNDMMDRMMDGKDGQGMRSDTASDVVGESGTVDQ